MRPSRMFGSAALLAHGSLLMGLDAAAGSRGIESIHVVDRSDSSCACAKSESSHQPNHMRPGRRRRFYLAILTERSKSTPRYDISRLRNHASHVSAHAIHARADRSPMHLSIAAEQPCARCKQSAWPVTWMTIGRHGMRRPPHDLLSLGMSISLPIFNSTDVAELRG